MFLVKVLNSGCEIEHVLILFLLSYQVARNLHNLAVLFALMRLVRSLVQNSQIHIELYVSLRPM